MTSAKMKLCLAVLVFVSVTGWSQSREEKKYALRAKEVEEEVLGVADPYFAVNTVPAQFEKSSAVILAKKVTLFSDLKSKVKYSLFYGKDVTNTIRYALTLREKVKIQDKNALEEYSEFSFRKIRSQSSFFRNATNTFYGITIIKPDGSSKKVNIDEDAVNAGDEDERNKFKLAMPGLQVGDIIDIYSRVEKESTSENPIEPMDIVMGGSYPIVNYTFDTKISNNFAIIYSINEKAPEPKQSKDAEYLHMNIAMQNIPATPDVQWLYERRELPVFKINILPGNTSRKNKENAPEKGQVLKGLPKEWIDSDLSKRIYNAIAVAGSGTYLADLSKEYIKNIRKEKGWKGTDSEKDSLINYLYYYGRFYMLYDYMSEDKLQIGLERNGATTGSAFYAYLITAFNYFGVDYDLIFSVPRSVGTINTAVSMDDFQFLVRAKGKKDYYLIAPTMYTAINTMPYYVEGQEAYVFSHLAKTGGISSSVVQKLPVTKPEYNFYHDQLEVSVDKANPQQLQINRAKVIRGNGAFESQVYLSLFEEYVDAERAKLGERTFKEEIVARVGKKRSEVLLQEYDHAFGEARKKREEYAKNEVNNSLDLKPLTLSDFKVLKVGNRHDQLDFAFTEKFTVDGVVKRAGNNYIVDIGSLIGGQVQVKNDQRNREQNIYMAYPRNMSYTITFNIPEGFSVEGLDKLQYAVDNEAGSFTCKAAEASGKVVFTISKVYKQSYIEKSGWNNLLAFVDAAYDFSQQKMLLKKK